MLERLHTFGSNASHSQGGGGGGDVEALDWLTLKLTKMFWRICKHVEFYSIYFAKESKKEGFALQSMKNNVERKPEGNHKLDKTY